MNQGQMNSLIYSGDSEAAEITFIDATISNYGWYCAVGAVSSYRCKCADTDWCAALGGVVDGTTAGAKGGAM